MGLDFGKAVGTACATFAITNVDDIFVLITFFTEASTSQTLTPLKIAIGQYVGFTVIIAVSMIGFGASLLIPAEPIGFLGLIPMLLGIRWLLGLIFKTEEEDDEDDAAVEISRTAGLKSIFKVASMTVMNGADNMSTYIPLFSQAKGNEVAIYVVVYYILLGLWCLAAYLIMKQKHILHIAQKYAAVVVPFFYIGLGIFIVVDSDCYPWSIEKIDDDLDTHPGKIILGVVTAVLMVACISWMLLYKLRAQPAQSVPDEEVSDIEGSSQPESQQEICNGSVQPVPVQSVQIGTSTEQK
ncbi:uncharacterized protein FIESC28_03414 [Fusarium coffeatum]|uniref:Cadmium resistance transporter n=1 Tax=Fusarium coffeatum TaxID=231269 RepID=A0A366S4J6_9HYPO|nr:uncharacterized protein FIESC28_03414 [Fusarium coffeatum]RBR23798.1 hypothetical protein FIESC28_03414 [Fusarium coffeatum]